MNLYYKLAILMGTVVVVSNYLVQFPIQKFGLSEILTYGAFSYPITFLITDLANRAYGKMVARKVVYIGFIIGILLTLFVSTNFNDIISIRIAIGSGVAFFVAQNLDVQIFDKLRKKKMVYRSACFIYIRLNDRHFFIFFNSFLRNRNSMVHISFGRFDCETFNCIIDVDSF